MSQQVWGGCRRALHPRPPALVAVRPPALAPLPCPHLLPLTCSITAVVVSNITGAVLYKEAIHVGPTPDSPKGCPPAFQQLRAFCGAYAAAPPGYCCDELAALGTVCQASLASGLGGDDLAVL